MPPPLQALYAREINFKIATHWDGGFDVALGDIQNDFKAANTVATFDEAAAWLTE